MNQAAIERDRSAGRSRPCVFFREEGADGIEKWLTFHRDRIVSCPHQPGNLKVSRDFCYRRRQAAEKVNGHSPPPLGLDEFQVMGLLRCRHCGAVRTGVPENNEKAKHRKGSC